MAAPMKAAFIGKECSVDSTCRAEVDAMAHLFPKIFYRRKKMQS